MGILVLTMPNIPLCLLIFHALGAFPVHFSIILEMALLPLYEPLYHHVGLQNEGYGVLQMVSGDRAAIFSL